MKSFDKDIYKYAQKTRLKASERRELRERVLTYMEYHPLPKHTAREAVEQIESERFSVVSFNTIYTRVVAGAFTALLLVVVPFAAERAVPGDVLYPFKTHVNEGVRSTFANSPYEKIALETELMERRIAEAQLLKREGKLTKEIEAAISEVVEEHANAAKQSIAALRTENSDDAEIAEIAFGSALEIQSAILNASKDHATTSASSSIAQVVRQVQEEIAAHRGTSTPSFEKLMARVELETTRTYELFEAITDSTTEKQREDIGRRLDDIGRKVEKAQEFHAADDPRATHQLISALVITQKLIAFMTNIDVSSTVSLESLVPVELTDEERIVVANELLNGVAKMQDTVEMRVPHIESESLAEKVSEGLEALSGSVQTATTAIESGNIDEAERAITNAYEFATDLIQMTSGVAVPDTDADEIGESDEEETVETEGEQGRSSTTPVDGGATGSTSTPAATSSTQATTT